jgi:VanZ family protein
MGLIFTASGDQASFQHSSGLVEPLLRWLVPQISAELLHAVILLVRKGAHLTEYAIFALLLWRALRQSPRHELPPWDWSLVKLALLLTALYAASDEFHQLFVPFREASVWDVLLDTTGGALALIALWSFGKWRKCW